MDSLTLSPYALLEVKPVIFDTMTIRHLAIAGATLMREIISGEAHNALNWVKLFFNA